MKHLFYIHSHITFIVSLQVIKYKKLKHEDCVFMYGRKFVPESDSLGIKHITVPYVQQPVNSFAVEKRFWKGWAKLHGFNKLIEQLIGKSEYHVYTHQTGMDFIRMFMSHKQCSGFSLIEEGVVSYLTLDKVNKELRPVGKATWRYEALKWVNYWGRLSFTIRFFDPGYAHAFGLSPSSFPGFPRKKLLPLAIENAADELPYKHVLVLDASVENKLTTAESMQMALKKTLDWLEKNGVRELWVKYHPEQVEKPASSVLYKDIFASYESRITIREIPQQVCLELLAGSQELKELTFYVFVSSVGIYAAMCGRKVYSFANFIAEADENYHKIIGNLPGLFSESVTFV
ncbi:hypothetical protein [Pontibacter mangrovi]|uniref:Uncharacterized protein n=1 Tax=Pontibacter mangrovi TaxID=2589816 RepID=A0A501W5Z8_9BACT|nr:hypothetical protein [Pontibacter mangrovi]TPE44708.1 hypothetical protein FJM65_06695 [Pontibacter mangrovi]